MTGQAPKLWFLGEALIDFVPVTVAGQRTYAPRPGGSSFNAAKAAAQAGARAGFLGAVSRDMFGDLLIADLAAHGVDTTLTPRSDAPSTLAFVDLQDGEPRYAFFNALSATARMAPDPAAFRPGQGDVVDVGSISLIDLPGADNIARFARAVAARAAVAIDPNARPVMTPDMAAWRARIEGILDIATIVKLSDEDLDALRPGMAAADFARDCLHRGAGIVIITHGAAGAEAFTAAAHVSRPGCRVTVVDTVGAGDTLMGTLLARLAAAQATRAETLGGLAAETLAGHLDFAIAAAALNCTASGCAPPTAADIAAALRPATGPTGQNQDAPWRD